MSLSERPFPPHEGRIMEDIEALLWELVDLVKRVAPEIWALTVRQSVVEGIAIALIGMIILAFSGLLWRSWYKKDQELRSKDANDRYYVLEKEQCFWLSVSATVVTLIGCVLLVGAFTILANPQYNAMHKLINFVG